MPKNPIQFQPGMSLSTFIEHYGSESACASALLRARWPDGFLCPECGARALDVPRRGAPLLAVRPVPGADDVALRDAVACRQGAPDHVVPGDLPGHPEQEQHLGTLACYETVRIEERMLGLVE